jgi:glycosyltransferase involved in cell wall biosynthesis
MQIKVLHLTNAVYGIGGVESLLLSASDKYDQSRFLISYCNLFCKENGNGAFPSAIRERGLTYHHIPGRSWRDLPFIVGRLVQLLHREQIDILHTHMLQSNIIGCFAARLARVPVRVITRHYTGDAYLNKSKLIQSMDWHTTRSANRIIAVSKGVQDYLTQHSIPLSHTTVIYNGIDLSAFDIEKKVLTSIPWDSSWENGFLIGYVGNLHKYKGHEVLLKALAEALKIEPRLRLVCIGEGPQREELENLSVRLGIKDKVLFAGFHKCVPSLLCRIDLYVHPSLWEAFGMAILEAMAAGKAVIGSEVGGIPEVILDGETGILVPSNDTSALARAIIKLSSNKEIRTLMGEQGRKRAEEIFSIRETLIKYQDIYSQLIN